MTEQLRLFLEPTYQQRKQARREHYAKNVHGWKQRPCSACNGSGRYDHHGSPPCSACAGSGKERYKPNPTTTP